MKRPKKGEEGKSIKTALFMAVCFGIFLVAQSLPRSYSFSLGRLSGIYALGFPFESWHVLIIAVQDGEHIELAINGTALAGNLFFVLFLGLVVPIVNRSFRKMGLEHEGLAICVIWVLLLVVLPAAICRVAPSNWRRFYRQIPIDRVESVSVRFW